MDVKKKLVELFQHDDCPLFMVFGDKVDVLADYLIAHGVTVQEWIPAAERLPGLKNSPCDVLAIHELKGDMFMDVAWYSYDKRRWCSCNGMNLNVTHWMPLPEPPKGE